MFEAVRNNRIITQAILGLIAITFAFFGLESYVRNFGSSSDVATIGDVKIDQREFQQALRQQQERLRAQLGEQFDARLLDTPEARQAALDDLINRRLLLLEASKRRLLVSNETVSSVISAVEAFQVDGKFSNERYEMAASRQGLSPNGFFEQVRQDLTLQQLIGALSRSGITANTALDHLLALQTEKRDVSEVRLALDDYLGQVKLADDAAKKYYDANSEQFRLPEQAMAEYVVLSPETLGGEFTASDNDVKAWYDNHQAQYGVPEERRASHILIDSAKHGSDKARAKAEEVLAEVRKNPGDFAELARKYSDDPGSASQGGDLGFFERGAMVKPFADAVFAMNEGDISAIVQSDFGFHIIKLTGIHAAGIKPLAEVRRQIEAEMKKADAARRFAEADEDFRDMVWNRNPDSLTPAAEKFKLEIVRTGWLGRQPDPANGPLGNEKLLAELFSKESPDKKHNTQAVEIAPNTLVAARLIGHKPETMQPFEGLQASIETLLRHQEAQTLAVKDGETRLAALQNGEDKQSWSASKTVSRSDPRQIPPAAAPVVFRMNAGKLPGYAGVAIPGTGYALYRLNRIEPGPAIDAANRKAAQGQLANLASQEEISLYLTALRARYKVEINQKALESPVEQE
jgi:peptidyl-prolyl cis-trans isomerase D